MDCLEISSLPFDPEDSQSQMYHEAYHTSPEFETRVEAIVKQVINDQLRRLMTAVWVMTISGFATLLAVGVAWGSLKAQVAANDISVNRHHHDSTVHMTDSTKMNLFVTRAEWTNVMTQQHETLKSFSETLHRIESRMDQFASSPNKL